MAPDMPANRIVGERSRDRCDPLGDLPGHPLHPRRRGVLPEMVIVRIAEPLVCREVAGHASQAGDPCDLVEHGTELFAERSAGGTVGRQSAYPQAAADGLDEGGGDAGVVGLVAVDHAVAAGVTGHHARDVVPEIDEPDDLVECGGRPWKEKPAHEKITGALDSSSGTEVAFVAVRRGNDRADEERAIDAPPGEAHGVVREPPAMHPEIAERAEPPGNRPPGQPPDGIPLTVRECGNRSDVLWHEEVVEAAVAGAIRGGWSRLHAHRRWVFGTLQRPGIHRGRCARICDSDERWCHRATHASRHERRSMPGILTKLIGGDLAALASDALGEFVRRSRQGGIVPLKIGLTRGHLVSDPALVRHMLLDNIDNYDNRTPAFDAVRVVLGNGMLTSDGSFWKRQRRIAQPPFHGEAVRHFAPIISRLAADKADEWERAAAAGEPVDACTDMMKVTLRIVAETLFGDDLAESADEVNRVFPVILACLAARVSSPVRPPLWLPPAKNRRLRAGARFAESNRGSADRDEATPARGRGRPGLASRPAHDPDARP